MPKKRRNFSEDRHEQMLKLAKNSFKDHVIASRGRGRWFLRKPKDQGTEYWCEVVAFAGGGLGVWGDIDLVLYAYCSNSLPIAMVNWMGGTESMGYVCEKARIGTGRIADEEFDQETAVEDIEELLREYVLDRAESDEDDVLAYLFAEVEEEYDENDEPLPTKEHDHAFWARMFREGRATKFEEVDVVRAMNLTKKTENFSMYWECREALDKLIEEKFDRFEHDDIDAFFNAIEAAQSYNSADLVYKELHDNSDVYNALDGMTNIGKQIPNRIYFTHAALRHLNGLLKDEAAAIFAEGGKLCGHCNSKVDIADEIAVCTTCAWTGPEAKAISK